MDLELDNDNSVYIYIFKTCSLKERLKEAAKAQVRRMCTLKKKRSYLNPPDWMVQAYNSRDKGSMAQLLMDVNFDKDWVLGF